MSLVLVGDCLELMRDMEDKSVDLVFCSPPYEAARNYGIGFTLKGQEWVDWAVERFVECIRVCRGLVAWNVEGQTRNFRYSATPILFAADLHRRGIHLRKPPIFHRVGIPGSGGPDWLRNDYEFIICGSRGGKLPWSDSTAMGQPPRYEVGGALSHRTQNCERINGRSKKTEGKARKAIPNGVDRKGYNAPSLANPGNVIKCKVGGGLMGSKLAHENEAPFPEKLAEFFVRSFCPPSGTVMDIFSGSGTTAAVAKRTGRDYVAIDIRESQVDLTRKRLRDVQPELQMEDVR